jgi:hypothetical protein
MNKFFVLFVALFSIFSNQAFAKKDKNPPTPVVYNYTCTPYQNALPTFEMKTSYVGTGSPGLGHGLFGLTIKSTELNIQLNTNQYFSGSMQFNNVVTANNEVITLQMEHDLFLGGLLRNGPYGEDTTTELAGLVRVFKQGQIFSFYCSRPLPF